MPPQSSGSNSPPSKSANPPISGGSSSGHASRTSPDTKSTSVSSTPPGNENDSTANTSTKAVLGAIVASALLIVLVAFVFVMRRRRRKRQAPYASHYMPPNNFTVKAGKSVVILRLPIASYLYDFNWVFFYFCNADGYYFGQQPHSIGYSGPINHSYGSQPPHSSFVDAYGSQRGNMYNGGEPDSTVIGSSKTFFSYDDLMEITNGFSGQNIIGEGGFGCVYKGWMPDGKVVAVKQLKAGSGQGDREFKAEVEIISRVHHRHLVSLVGYCISDQQRLLIYEFVPNNTLDYHLHGKAIFLLFLQACLVFFIFSFFMLSYQKLCSYLMNFV